MALILSDTGLDGSFVIAERPHSPVGALQIALFGATGGGTNDTLRGHAQIADVVPGE